MSAGDDVIGCFTLAVVLAATLAAALSPRVVAVDPTTGRTLLCAPAGGRLTLAYTHSMYGGEVREEFAAGGDGRLSRVAMTTANAAAAEYYAYDAAVVREGARFRVDVPAAAYDEVVVRVDRVGDHRLRAGGREVDLVAEAGSGGRVALRVRPVALVSGLVPGRC